MHVLYVVGQSTGGLPHYTAELANSVAKHADVTVMKPRHTTADDLFDDRVNVVGAFRSISVSMPKLYSLDVNLLDFVRGVVSYDQLKRIPEFDLDIVHDTTGMFPQVRMFSSYHGITDQYPLVMTRHEVPMNRFSLSRPPVLAEEILNILLPDVNAAKTIVHTEKQRDALIKRGENSDDIKVIPHGAYSVFGSAADIDVDPEPNTLLFFGNIVPPKGLDTLVEAIPLIKQDIPDVKLIIAGDGKIPRKTQSLIDVHEENFEIHNYFVPNDEVGALFARAEVTVMPYREQGGTKGHSGSLATAFSFGNPVVASTAGEFPEQVEEQGCGTVVPPEDPERLAEAVTRVLNDDNRRKSMAANSLKMADRLSWDSIAQQHLDLYRGILRQQRFKLSPEI